MQTIFNTYTGNAMLNNALMTIEALGGMKNVLEITPTLLLKIYEEKSLLKLNKRLKNYTMLFTKNGPLHNDKNNGDKVYDTLFKTIIEIFENEGENICEISGLKFQTPFNKVYEIALAKVGLSAKEIANKDTTISRTWFPLIGGLGSDAQALPQAKFSIQIHPICIVILQFLPLSSLLYKGGVLLIDSANFGFAKQFIFDNQKLLQKHIETTKSTEQIENVRFTKGNYVLKAIEILEDKEEFEEEYSDLNLWSFSNSGTGASCEIDRVPNSLIRKLVVLKNVSPSVGDELKKVLNGESSFKFLDSLERNQEWWLLYPNVFGTGKKRTEYEGVSELFLEVYFEVTGNAKHIEYAKYLAYLVDKYKTPSFDKYLVKTDAWNEKEYRIDLYSVLVEATKNDKWNLNHQLQILDNSDVLPIKNNYYNLHKLIHFYYQKGVFAKEIPAVNDIYSNAKAVCDWFISLIQNDENSTKIISSLINRQEYSSVSYSRLFERILTNQNIDLKLIACVLYDEHLLLRKNGLNELLHLFFSQPEKPTYPIKKDFKLTSFYNYKDQFDENWFKQFDNFSNDYQQYYFDKYQNRLTGAKPYNKYLTLVKGVSLESSKFHYWFRDALENVNDFLRQRDSLKIDKWTEDLLYNAYGEYSPSFTKLAIKLSLLKNIQQSINTSQPIIT